MTLLEKKERTRANSRRYREKHKDEIRARRKTWRMENLSRVRLRDRLWAKEARDKAAESRKKYRVDHPERVRDSWTRWYLKNREKQLLAAKEYRRKNPWSTKFGRQKCSLVKRSGLAASKVIIQAVYEENIQQYGTLTCEYCSRPTAFGKDSLDHRIPLLRGGDNSRGNLVVACRSCNSRKGPLTENEFRLREM